MAIVQQTETDPTTTKTRILSLLERIENQLEDFKSIPEEVRQLREEIGLLRSVEFGTGVWNQAVWRALLRSAKHFISLIEKKQ